MMALQIAAALAVYLGAAVLLGRFLGLADRRDAIHKAEYLGLDQLTHKGRVPCL